MWNYRKNKKERDVSYRKNKKERDVELQDSVNRRRGDREAGCPHGGIVPPETYGQPLK